MYYVSALQESVGFDFADRCYLYALVSVAVVDAPVVDIAADMSFDSH